jgi:hypothetical protein
LEPFSQKNTVTNRFALSLSKINARQAVGVAVYLARKA